MRRNGMPKTTTKNDRAVAEAVSQMRLATKEEVMEYTGFGQKKAEKHITRAKEFGLIFSKYRASNVPDLLSDDKHYFGRLSELTFDHELLISLTHARLHRAFTIEDWQQGRETYTDYVRPDSFFTLGNKDKVMDYYLEADRYKMGRSDNRKQMLEKWQGYIKLFQERLSKYGPFRVITVTTSEARAKNLARGAEQVVGRGARQGYLFTTIDKFKVPGGEICFGPYEESLYPILP
jgi:hypothetical protein